MMGYEQAIKTQLMATRCVCCGLPLVDAESVERGMGPECSGNGYGVDTLDDVRIKANEITRLAAIAAQDGKIAKVLEFADQIDALGLPVLSDLVRKRFKNAHREAKIKIAIQLTDDIMNPLLVVSTPFRRGESKAFIAAWREIPGRKYDRNRKVNLVPMSSKPQLWELLKQFFPGMYANGPMGLFRVSKPASEE